MSTDASPSPLAYFGALSDAQLASVAASPSPSLNSLLSSSRAFVSGANSASAATSTPPHVHVIFGNEACDFDSIVSAIVLAWYLRSVHAGSSASHVFVPMLPISREDLALRGEADFALRQAGVDPTLLLFQEDVDLRRISQSHALSVILVDHNQLKASQAWLAPHVAAILDHHEDMRLYPRTHHADLRQIEVVGSCTSLIGEMILARAPCLLSETNFAREIDPTLAPAPIGVLTLLLQTLLLDTNDMSVETKKATPKDVRLHAEYQSRLQHLTHAELKRRRSDISHLTTRQLLRKDVKYGDNVSYPHMVCSVPCGVRGWTDKDADMMKTVATSARDESLKFVVLLTSHTDSAGAFRREITLIVPREKEGEDASGATATPSAALFRALTHSLESATTILDVVPADEALLAPTALAAAAASNVHVRAYTQRNLAGSRKQVAPLLEGLLSKL